MGLDGYKALLAFYNQTYHAMTMAAGLRTIGESFEIDDELAKNMLGNVERVLCYVDGLSQNGEMLSAWKGVEKCLKSLPRALDLNHTALLNDFSLLTYLTWTKLCNNPVAIQCAGEYYTTIEHPERHPGASAIKAISNVGQGGCDLPATRSNVAALIERMNKTSGRRHNKRKTSGLES